MWCHGWQGNGLVIHRSLVQVLAGHHCIVAFGQATYICASVTKQSNFVLAKGNHLFEWESNCGPGGK